MEDLGRHLMFDLWDCNAEVDCPETVRRAIVDAVDAIGATLLNVHVHCFSPQGVTGLAVLAESHFSVHSWPEHGFLAADVFTCGTESKLHAALDVLKRYFQPGHVEVRELRRGVWPLAEVERPPRLDCDALTGARGSLPGGALALADKPSVAPVAPVRQNTDRG